MFIRGFGFRGLGFRGLGFIGVWESHNFRVDVGVQV